MLQSEQTVEEDNQKEKQSIPLAVFGPDKLWATVQATRLECKMQKEQLQEMKEHTQDQVICIEKSLEEDIHKIMDWQNLNATPHMKFFWDEQIQLLQSASCCRSIIHKLFSKPYHFMESHHLPIESSGKVVLWCYLVKVLHDYKNYFLPKAGINKENVDALQKKTASLTGNQ